MKVKTLLCICALLFSLAVAAQSPQPERYPKREFRAAWIQAVNGQFRGKGQVSMPSFFRYVLRLMLFMLPSWNRGVVF